MSERLSIALASETGRGMDAAIYAVDAIVQRNVAVFANLEQVMANHHISHAWIGGLRVGCGTADAEPPNESEATRDDIDALIEQALTFIHQDCGQKDEDGFSCIRCAAENADMRRRSNESLRALQSSEKESCGKPGDKVTAFVHRIIRNTSIEHRSTTHGGVDCEEIAFLDVEGRFIRLRIDSEDVERLCDELNAVAGDNAGTS